MLREHLFRETIFLICLTNLYEDGTLRVPSYLVDLFCFFSLHSLLLYNETQWKNTD
jgi:hypothetical protein